MTGSKARSAATALVALMVGLLAACGRAREAETSQTVKLAMGFIPDIQFAPFYVAVEKGRFADEGLEVEFDYGWETDLLKLLGSDELQFAIASGDQVILARSQELPVVYVLNWYRRFPVCVVSLAEVGIIGRADLADRRVGTPATYGASYIGWRALLDAVGLEERDVELVSIGYTQPAALDQGQVDAVVCYAMNEPGQMEAEGQDLDISGVRVTAVMVTHNLQEAVFLADRVQVMSPRPGHLRTEVVVDLPRPRTLDVMYTEFFGALLRQVRNPVGDRIADDSRSVPAERDSDKVEEEVKK